MFTGAKLYSVRVEDKIWSVDATDGSYSPGVESPSDLDESVAVG